MDNNILVAVIFTSLCIVILINGFNFTDGVHGLTILYAISTILLFNYFIYFILDYEFILNNCILLIPILFAIYILNIKEKLFLGDSGSYFLAAVIGIMIINTTTNKNYSYPYVYACLLIYPCFEVFFSIIRKFYNNKNPLNADRKHLHHLLQYYFINNNNIKNNLKKIASGLLINIFVFLFGLISVYFYQNKYILIFNIFIFIFIYLISYYFLYKKMNN